MNYKSMVNRIVSMAHIVGFEEREDADGVRRFEQLVLPYYGIYNNPKVPSQWVIYKGERKKIIEIGTEENGIFDKFVDLFKLSELDYELYGASSRVMSSKTIKHMSPEEQLKIAVRRKYYGQGNGSK